MKQAFALEKFPTEKEVYLSIKVPLIPRNFHVPLNRIWKLDFTSQPEPSKLLFVSCKDHIVVLGQPIFQQDETNLFQQWKYI